MFSQRSQENELLDLGPNYFTQQEYDDCMRKLFTVNKLLGFFRSTVNTLRSVAGNATVLDIGCGGGDFVIELSKYFPHMQFTGVDISIEAIDVANSVLKNTSKIRNVNFQLQTEPQLQLTENSVDVIITTLVCHHINDNDLVDFIINTNHAAKQMVVINDLHRHKVAEWLYSIISPFFRNRLITHDGLISIRRGFIRSDWKTLLAKANIKDYKIKWCFPFRWKVIIKKNNN